MHRFALATLLTIAVAGCRPPVPPPPPAVDYAKPLPPHAVALRKLDVTEYPDFGPAANAPNRAAVLAAIDHSLTWLARPGSRAAFPYADIDHGRAVETLRELKRVLAGITDGPTFNTVVRARFDCYQSVGGTAPDGRPTGTVLFTGYCTPVYDAALTQGGRYQFPIYKRPPNPDQYTRRQIEQDHVLAGTELAWLTTRFDAYVVTIQGSARLRLPDGTRLDVGTAGTNGRDYTSPGRQLVADGRIPADQLNLPTLRAYFTAHPAAADRYLWRNDRTAFFTPAPGDPVGRLNVPVTPYATLATDPAVFPAALPAFVTVTLATPDGGTRDFRGLMLNQDAGGGIRAAGRADVYTGVGPAAEAAAGRQLSVGTLYFLAVRPGRIDAPATRP